MATREVSDAVSNHLEDGVIYPFFAVEMLFDNSPLRLWNGLGTLVFDEKSWVGSGNLLDVSSVEETSEISARGATLTLSGVPSEVTSLALQEPYQGRVANIYFGLFSQSSSQNSLRKEDFGYLLLEDGSKIYLESQGEIQEAGPTQVFSGYMDEMNIDEGAEYSTIELKVENKLIDLERQRVRRYTSAYQKTQYPGDKGFDFVESIQNEKTLWGKS